jgi:hypothetical protein
MDTRVVVAVLKKAKFIIEKGKGGESIVRTPNGQRVASSVSFRNDNHFSRTMYTNLRRQSKRLGYSLPAMTNIPDFLAQKQVKKKPKRSAPKPKAAAPLRTKAAPPPPSEPKPKLLTVRQIVERYGATQGSVNRHCHLGTFEADKIGHSWYVDQASFEKALAEGRIKILGKRKKKEGAVEETPPSEPKVGWAVDAVATEVLKRIEASGKELRRKRIHRFKALLSVIGKTINEFLTQCEED